MWSKFAVPFAVFMAALIFAPLAVAMPADECARWCSGRSDYNSCLMDCLYG
jgi:hypothetical protein